MEISKKEPNKAKQPILSLVFSTKKIVHITTKKHIIDKTKKIEEARRKAEEIQYRLHYLT